MRVVRFAGFEAVTASVALLMVALARGVGLNRLNGWTILLGLVGGLVLAKEPSPRLVRVAWVLVALAMLPALVGGLGLFYLPALVIVPIRMRLRPHASTRVG